MALADYLEIPEQPKPPRGWRGRANGEARPNPQEVPPFDYVGLLRRARRNARLSQRAMAQRIGVSKSTIAEAESDNGRVSLPVLLAVLAAGGIDLIAVDDGDEVLTMRPDELRDRGGRKLPAHLHARIATHKDFVPEHWKGSHRRNAPVQWNCRERYGREAYLPLLHPGEEDVPRALEWAAYERDLAKYCRKLRAEDAATRRQPMVRTECYCSDRCIEDGRACPPECPCQCDAPGALIVSGTNAGAASSSPRTPS